MPRDLGRLLRPRSIAVVGGGAWCKQVVRQSRKIGFQGEIWPVHPDAPEIYGVPAFASVDALPKPPDATFIGVNRHVTIDIVGALSAMGAGGAVCFASGFLEAQAEDVGAIDLQARLLAAAGDMPILGPNCYGLINYLDGALLWPDQHGGQRCEKGVALVLQSSNIAINLTMQKRGLPIAYVATVGNQAQCSVSQIGEALLDDPRVTALGLYIEGIGDLRAFEALAARARDLGKAIVVLKMGRSDQARQAALSHTASLAGGDAGAEALLRRLGMLRVTDLTAFLETLKLLHVGGRLAQNTLASISCSGGEASLASDSVVGRNLSFPPLTPGQQSDLRAALGPRVALANPLDYHTYIWRDVPAMTAAFAAMAGPGIGIVLLVVDFPRADRCDPDDWDCTIEATIAAAQQTGARYGMVATLPELMPEDVAARLMEADVVPFCGLEEALDACAIAARPLPEHAEPVLLPTPVEAPTLATEAEAKAMLAQHGLRVPRSARFTDAAGVPKAATSVGFPQVLKGEGVAHKTEAGAVRLNLQTADQTVHAAADMPCSSFLIEEMVTGGVAELLIGVLHDPAHGYVLTLAAGGTLTELWQDSASLIIPASDTNIEAALRSLRIAPLLTGHRGAAPADMAAILRAVRAVQDYVLARAEGLAEIEINPLICTPTDAIAVDALLRRSD
ncbi:acetate--CoA ligase family protein [Sulfitobacter sp. JB4-11]|uniref:acetate--CoA ligase family protein n=1 Tax=Sulfitobacter rhodophyticola TaxID=3238304 RepID=UPI003D814230